MSSCWSQPTSVGRQKIYFCEGWFGPVDPAMADRIGDVVAAPVGSLAIVATRTEPRESALVGMHGSLTAADQLIPALSYSVI